MRRIMEGAEPFFFPGGRTGCLLVHGFTGTPKEMRGLGEHLGSRGHTVLGVRLFAHATQVEDMLRARWPDWLSSVEDGYYLLRGACDRILVMGLSMGGCLSLLFASRYPVSGVVAMSTPFDPPDPRMRLRPIAPLLLPFWKYGTGGPADWHDPEVARDHLEYVRKPVRGAEELYDLMAEVRGSLSRVTAPALVIHSHGDRIVPAAHAPRILEALASADKDLLWVEDSGHVVTRDREHARVFAAIDAFIQRAVGKSA